MDQPHDQRQHRQRGQYACDILSVAPAFRRLPGHGRIIP
jgi:hypothetical protein